MKQPDNTITIKSIIDKNAEYLITFLINIHLAFSSSDALAHYNFNLTCLAADGSENVAVKLFSVYCYGYYALAYACGVINVDNEFVSTELSCYDR